MKLRLSGILIVALSMMIPVIWLPGMVSHGDPLAIFSQYLGLTSIIAMATLQIIATRWPGVELTFGPMDQSYRLHKWLGLWALLAAFLHDTIDADIDGIGSETFLTDIAETAGEIGLNGLILLVIITVATFIPYHLWKWTHRFIGVFFLLSVFHYLFILKPFSNTDPLGLYMLFICIAGLVAYTYTSAPRRFRPSRPYEITQLKKAGDALSVELTPKTRPLKHRAGQFAFISFSDLGLSEPHPFTISSAPQSDGKLRMTIGPLGDYTIRLMSRLEIGAQARVEGPFGDFGQARGAQIWIAAGIGITPFAAMAGQLTTDSKPITLIYSVREREKAAHLEELESRAKDLPDFNVMLWETTEKGRLTPPQVAEIAGDLTSKHVLYCGPEQLRNALKQELPKFGLSSRRFHYELFEIRTGVGLQTLFDYLVKRVRQRQQVKNNSVT